MMTNILFPPAEIATIVMKNLYNNTQHVCSDLRTFLHFALDSGFFQFVSVPEGKINTVLGLSFAGVWWIKLAVLLAGF